METTTIIIIISIIGHGLWFIAGYKTGKNKATKQYIQKYSEMQERIEKNQKQLNQALEKVVELKEFIKSRSNESYFFMDGYIKKSMLKMPIKNESNFYSFEKWQKSLTICNLTAKEYFKIKEYLNEKNNNPIDVTSIVVEKDGMIYLK